MNRYFLTYKSKLDGYEYFKTFKKNEDMYEFINSNKIDILKVYHPSIFRIASYQIYLFFVLVFEKINGVDFLTPKLQNIKNCNAYELTHSYSIKKIAKKLKIKYGSSLLDVGCGKGWALYNFRKYFNHLYGIEMDEELISICMKNLIKFGVPAILINETVEECDINENINYIFMFNPFCGDIMDKFIKKFSKKNVCIIYHNPVCDGLMKKHGFSITKKYKDILGTDIFVYEN